MAISKQICQIRIYINNLSVGGIKNQDPVFCSFNIVFGIGFQKPLIFLLFAYELQRICSGGWPRIHFPWLQSDTQMNEILYLS